MLARSRTSGFLAWLLLLGGCCSAPGPDVTHKFAHERDAVKRAVQNADIDGVPVYETPRPQDACEGEHGCCDSCGIVVPSTPILMPSRFCPPDSTNPGCWDTPSEVALHEYVHAALGPSSASHPPEFGAALSAAQRMLE